MKPDSDSNLRLCLDFERAVTAALKNCSSNAIFLTAVSGGADSMAMLTALHQNFTFNSSFADRQLSVLHVEHGLRPSQESCADAEFVRSFCQKHGIICTVKNIPQGKIAAFAQRKGIGIEAAARHFRHKALAAEAARLGENTYILIGHTKDDMLETVLMRVLRGSGPAGLSAMDNTLVIQRPIISLSRTDVLAYLQTKGVSWCEDATNADDVFLRNRIRNRLVPLLDETFPSWRTGVSSMAETQSLVKEFIAEEAKQRIRWEVNANYSFSANAEIFFSQSLILREEAVFQVIDELLKNKKNLRSVRRVVVRRFCRGSINAANLGNVLVIRARGEVVVSRVEKEVFERGISILL